MKVRFLPRLFGRADAWTNAAERRLAPEAVANAAAALEMAGFSSEGYRAAHEDLIKTFSDARGALLHFLLYCGEEIRHFPIDLSLDGLRLIPKLRAPTRFKAGALKALINASCTPSSRLWTLPIEEQSRFWREVLEIVNVVGTPFIVAGDSHAQVYARLMAPADRDDGLYLVPIYISCSGCSGLGLSNPNSRSGAGARLAMLAHAIPEGVDFLFKFGQVDVEFVFAFKRISAKDYAYKEADFQTFCERSTDSYVQFLMTNFSRHCVTVASIFPPTLSDDAWRSGYANAHVVAIEADLQLAEVIAGVRDLEVPPMPQRTQSHTFYNELLEKKATQAGIGFLNDFPFFLGPNGVVDPIYIPMGRGGDHHLEYDPVAPVLTRLISDYFARREPKRDQGIFG